MENEPSEEQIQGWKKEMIEKAERKNIPQKQLSKLSRVLKWANKAGMAMARGGKSFRSSKHIAPQSFSNSKMISSNIARAVGQRMPSQYQGRKGYSSRGRPHGPSGRYFIPGVGSVGVYQFRKLASQQRQARRQAYEAQMMAIQQNPQLAQMYAEGKIAPQNVSESASLNAPQSTITPQVILQQPPQNPFMSNPKDDLFGGFNAMKVASPFKEIEDRFMSGFGVRRRQI